MALTGDAVEYRPASRAGRPPDRAGRMTPWRRRPVEACTTRPA